MRLNWITRIVIASLDPSHLSISERKDFSPVPISRSFSTPRSRTERPELCSVLSILRFEL
jgi:hypothetical protein